MKYAIKILVTTMLIGGGIINEAYAVEDTGEKLINSLQNLIEAVGVGADPDKGKLTAYPDGRRVLAFLDGQTQTRYPDGRGEIVFPDGQTETSHPDGKTVVIFPNGNKKTIYPDGRVE